jgi:hypothetical protein
MQNKPNFQKVKNIVTLVKTMTNNNEQPTMNYSKQTQTNPILSASADSVLSPSFPILKIFTITICCMLPKLPKFTRVIGFGAKNSSFKKAIFDVNKPHSALKLGVTLCL